MTGYRETALSMLELWADEVVAKSVCEKICILLNINIYLYVSFSVLEISWSLEMSPSVFP